MNTYIVSYEKPIGRITLQFNSYTRDAAVWAQAKARQEFRRIVEDFAAQYPGQVEIVTDKSNWISQTVALRTTAALAKKLGKTAGIRDVFESKKQKYVVSASVADETKSASDVKTAFGSKQARKEHRIAGINARKNEHQVFLQIIKDFAADHPGHIKIVGDNWLIKDVTIEAEPGIIEKLRKVAGIGDVTKHKPARITLEAPSAP